MAIAFDVTGAGSTYSNSGTTLSVTIASVANRYMLVNTESNIASITYAGVSLSLLTTYVPTSTGGANVPPTVKVWGLANPATGSNNLVVTGSGGTTNYRFVYIVYNGVDSVQPPAYNTAQTNASPGSINYPSLATSLTSTINNSWIAQFFVTTGNVGRTISVPSAGVLRASNGEGPFGPLGMSIFDTNAVVTPAGTNYTFTGSFSSGNAQAGSVTYEIKPYLSFGFSGPASGNVNSASTNFTVTPDIAVNGTVTITPSGGGLSTPIVLTFNNSATPQTFTITPSNSGTVTLTMTNGVGLNNPTALTYSAIAVIPTAPVIGTATPGNTNASITFSAPASDGGSVISSYRAISTPGSFTGTGGGSPIIVSGLSNGTPYTFTVRATNGIGNGPESSASNSATPYVAATTFTFTGPSSGSVRSASTNFTITPNNIYDGTITLTLSGVGSTGLNPVVLTFAHTSAAQTFTITPIASGSITLTPTNSNGLSNPSNLTYTANAVVPLAPQIGLAEPSLSSARVTVSAPTNDGGASVTLYTVTSSPGSLTATSSSPGTITVLGLTNGTSYTFTAKATNSVGQSAASSASNAVTPSASSTSFTNSGPKFNIDRGVGNLITF